MVLHTCNISQKWYTNNRRDVIEMKIDIKGYLDHQELTIYRVAKISGYGYTTLHKSFNKEQSKATSMNLRDLDALAQAQHKAMWEVLRELEEGYLVDDDDDENDDE